MGATRPKRSTKSKSLKPKAEVVEPIAYTEFVKDKPEPEIDLNKAYEWTRHYSYDPSGNTYIRSMPEGSIPDPDDVQLTYAVECPECGTKIDYTEPNTLYKCTECKREFKI